MRTRRLVIIAALSMVTLGVLLHWILGLPHHGCGPSRTYSLMESVGIACDHYHQKLGRWPDADTATDLLVVLTRRENGYGPFLLRGKIPIVELVRDQWGNELVLLAVTKGRRRVRLLVSAGPDGTISTADDISVELWWIGPAKREPLADDPGKRARAHVAVKVPPRETGPANDDTHPQDVAPVLLAPGKKEILPFEPTSMLVSWMRPRLPSPGSLIVRATSRKTGDTFGLTLRSLRRKRSPADGEGKRALRARCPIYYGIRAGDPALVFVEQGIYDVELWYRNRVLASAVVSVVAPASVDDPAQRAIRTEEWLRLMFSGEDIRQVTRRASREDFDRLLGIESPSVFNGYLQYALGMWEWYDAARPVVRAPGEGRKKIKRWAETAVYFERALEHDLDPYYEHRARLQLALCSGHAGRFDETRSMLEKLLHEEGLEDKLAAKAREMLKEITDHLGAPAPAGNR